MVSLVDLIFMESPVLYFTDDEKDYQRPAARQQHEHMPSLGLPEKIAAVEVWVHTKCSGQANCWKWCLLFAAGLRPYFLSLVSEPHPQTAHSLMVMSYQYLRLVFICFVHFQP